MSRWVSPDSAQPTEPCLPTIGLERCGMQIAPDSGQSDRQNLVMTPEVTASNGCAGNLTSIVCAIDIDPSTRLTTSTDLKEKMTEAGVAGPPEIVFLSQA